jgi:long-chain acyl-CoA synthetase
VAVSRAATAPRWFEDRAAVGRYVTDLVAGELAALRPGSPLPPRPWPDDLHLDHRGLDCDSLEMMALATAVSEATHMHRSGVADYLLARRSLGDWIEVVTASRERFDAEIAFRSSGTTAAPVTTSHPLVQLWEEIGELGELLGPRRRLIAAVPAHHIYGFLFTVLLPAQLGVAVLDVRDRAPASLAAELRPGDLVIGHPTFWGALARSVPCLPADVFGVSSTAPCPPRLAHDLADRGLGRLLQVYGSSETSGIGWRDTPDGDYRLLSHWQRAGEAALRRAQGPQLPIPDRVRWTDERRFAVGGRARPGRGAPDGGTRGVPAQGVRRAPRPRRRSGRAAPGAGGVVPRSPRHRGATARLHHRGGPAGRPAGQAVRLAANRDAGLSARGAHRRPGGRWPR